MLAVLLTILKVIGIILLCILGLVLLLVLLVLFCPIRYEIRFDVPDKRENAGSTERSRAADSVIGRGRIDNTDARAAVFKSSGYARVSWLLHLIVASFTYPAPEEGSLYLRVAFFTLIPAKERKRRGSEETAGTGEAVSLEEGWDDDETAPDAGDAVASAGEETDGTAVSQVEGSEGSGDAKTERADESAASDEKDTNAAGSSDPENSQAEADAAAGDAGASGTGEPYEKRDAGSGKTRRPLADTLRDLFEKPELAAKKIYYTISGTCDKIRMVRATIKSRTWLRAKHLLLKETGRVLRHIIPRKTRAEITYGAETPKGTADVLAYAGMLYPVLGDSVRITPDFEEAVLFGSGYTKGRLMLVVPVWSFLRCFLSRDVRKIYRRYKKIREHGNSDFVVGGESSG